MKQSKTQVNFVSPYCADKQLAKEYNRIVDKYDDDEWLCFVDADVMFLTSNFGQHIQAIIDAHSRDFTAFTCMTNRVGQLKQCHAREMSNNFDVLHHVKIAEKKQRESGLGVVEMKPFYLLSGLLICAKVSTFKRVPFKGAGMLGVDNRWHKDLYTKGGRLGLMLGVYVFHRYRNQNPSDKSHLK